MAALRKRNTILEEFIEIYKSEPCIWRIKDKSYHDRDKKRVAYEKLINKLRELEPNASKDDVIKKINSLRSNVRRELRKIEESSKSGASVDEIYKPSLWYFEMFEFLGDTDTPRTSQSNIEDNATDEIEEIAVNVSDHTEHTSSDIISEPDHTTQNSGPQQQQQQSTENQPKKSRPSKKKNDQDILTNEVLLSVRDHFKRPAASPLQPEDRYDLLGKTVALKLRTMEKRQRLIAEKIINDTLFEGEIGNLSSESYQNRVPPQIYGSGNIYSPSSISHSSNSPRHTLSPSPSLMQQFQYIPLQANSSQNSQFLQLNPTSTSMNNYPTGVQLSIPENSNSSQNPLLIQLDSMPPTIKNSPANVQNVSKENIVSASSYFSNFEL